MEKTIAVIRGDGIGPEIVEQALGVLRRVEERFGQQAHPLYERLARYFQILDSYRFIEWAGPKNPKKVKL